MRELDLLELEERANEGDYEACLELSRRYREGDGVEVNHDLADRYTAYASEFGEAPTQEVIEEESVQEEPVQIENKFKEASILPVIQLQERSEDGDVYATYALAKKYFSFPNNEEEGFQLLLQCESLIKENLKKENNPENHALFIYIEDEIGHCYEAGKHVTQSNALAFEHYSNAYEFDESHSVEIIRCYENGIGTEQNTAKVKEIHEKALQNKGIIERYTYALARKSESHFDATIWLQKALLSDDVQQHPTYCHFARYQLALLNETDEKGNAINKKEEIKCLRELKNSGDITATLFLYNNGLVGGKKTYLDAHKNTPWVDTYDYVEIEKDLENIANNDSESQKKFAKNALANIRNRYKLKQELQTLFASLPTDVKDEKWDTVEKNHKKIVSQLEHYENHGSNTEKEWASKCLELVNARDKYKEHIAFKNTALEHLNKDKRNIPFSNEEKVNLKGMREELALYIKSVDPKEGNWAIQCVKYWDDRNHVTSILDFQKYVNSVTKAPQKHKEILNEKKYKQIVKALNDFSEGNPKRIVLLPISKNKMVQFLFRNEEECEKYKEWAQHSLDQLEVVLFKEKFNELIPDNFKYANVRTVSEDVYQRFEKQLKEFQATASESDKAWAERKLELLSRQYRVNRVTPIYTQPTPKTENKSTEKESKENQSILQQVMDKLFHL